MRARGNDTGQRCGTCGHPHCGELDADGRWPDCLQCGCDRFDLHPDEVAELAAAVERNDAWFPDGSLLDGQQAHALAAGFTLFERTLFLENPWGGRPAFGVFLGALVPDGGDSVAGRPMMPMSSVPLPMPLPVWEAADGDVVAALEALAELCEDDPQALVRLLAERHVEAATDPVIGWWVSAEAWMHSPDGTPLGEARETVMADVDERIHRRDRRRLAGGPPGGHGDEPVAAMLPVAEYERRFRALLARYGDRGIPVGPSGGLPATVESVLRLMRLTRVLRRDGTR